MSVIIKFDYKYYKNKKVNKILINLFLMFVVEIKNMLYSYKNI